MLPGPFMFPYACVTDRLRKADSCGDLGVLGSIERLS
ncbi:uncharacterized protein J3R85_000412 [Psidium guajava]|nr:uncharacterized protein J3R85_000412 [Psidium guajava]